MKINDKCLALVERQVGIEEYSSRVYLAMANWCGFYGYEDSKSYYMSRAAEELKHRDKIFGFLLDCNYKVKMGDVPTPEYVINVLEDTIQQALIHEQKVSKAILEIMTAAEAAKDYNTHVFFSWFVDEQREEESTYIDLIDWSTQMGLINGGAPDWAKGMMRVELDEKLGGS